MLGKAIQILTMLIVSSVSVNNGCGKPRNKPSAPLPPDKNLKEPSPSESPTPIISETPTPSPFPSPSQEIAVIIRPTQESIQNDFVNRKCVGCHQSATDANRFVQLTNLSDVIETITPHEGHNHESGAARANLIKPGCPDQSMFLMSMREGKMPKPPATRIPDSELAVIAEWILSLNPNAGESCDTGEPPEVTVEPGEPE